MNLKLAVAKTKQKRKKQVWGVYNQCHCAIVKLSCTILYSCRRCQDSNEIDGIEIQMRKETVS